MQKWLPDTSNSLPKCQARAHRSLVRSLDLQCHYNLRSIEQQQRHYRRMLDKLSSASTSGSGKKPLLNSARKPCPSFPALHMLQPSGERVEGMGSQRGECATEAEQLGSKLVGENQSRDTERWASSYVEQPGMGESAQGKRLSKRSHSKPDWARLSFEDIKHRHRARLRTQEPFRKWHHLLLSVPGPSVSAHFHCESHWDPQNPCPLLPSGPGHRKLGLSVSVGQKLGTLVPVSPIKDTS